MCIRDRYPGPWFGHWLRGGQEKRCPAIRRVATSRAAKQIPVVSARPRRRHTAAKRDAAMLVRVHAGKCCCAQGGVDERPEQPVVRGVSSMASVDGTTPAVGERGSSTYSSYEGINVSCEVAHLIDLSYVFATEAETGVQAV